MYRIPAMLMIGRNLRHLGLAIAGLSIPAVLCSALPVWAADEGWSQEKEVAEIRQLIAEHGWDWEAGPTSANSMPPEERGGLLGLIPPAVETREQRTTGVPTARAGDEIPEWWDWRALGGMTPVKHQGACGSAWAFAAVGALESLYKITTGQQEVFSEKQCINCNEYGYGCAGGSMHGCYELWTWFGAVSSDCIPYQYPLPDTCWQNECDIKARITGTVFVPNTEEDLKTAVMTHPIAVVMHVTTPFTSYTGGCYAGSNGPPNHAILLCGWDNTACGGNGAWLLKNSWGTNWGESGYAWIQFGTSGLQGPSDLLQFEPFPEARVAYRSHEMLEGCNGGLDPNELVEVPVTVTNYAHGEASGIIGRLYSCTPGITVINNTASYPNLGDWESATSLPPHFTVRGDPPQPPGTPAEFLLVMESEQSVDSSRFFDFISPVDIIYENDFEGSTEGWSHDGIQGTDDWQLGDPRTFESHWDPKGPASGDNLFGNDLNTGGWPRDGLYANEFHCYLQSPTINCSGQTGVHLLFRRWLVVEHAPQDLASIQVNGNEIWRNAIGIHQLDRTWVPAVFDISAYADDNPSVQIRFDLETDTYWKFGGWNIDDFQIIATNIDPAAVGHHPLASQTLSISARTNPVTAVTELALTVPRGARAAKVMVLDAEGRIVRVLQDGPIDPGVHQLFWTGRGAAGQTLPAGTYYCRAQCGQQRAVAKVVWLP